MRTTPVLFSKNFLKSVPFLLSFKQRLGKAPTHSKNATQSFKVSLFATTQVQNYKITQKFLKGQV